MTTFGHTIANLLGILYGSCFFEPQIRSLAANKTPPVLVLKKETLIETLVFTLRTSDMIQEIDHYLIGSERRQCNYVFLQEPDILSPYKINANTTARKLCTKLNHSPPPILVFKKESNLNIIHVCVPVCVPYVCSPYHLQIVRSSLSNKYQIFL